MQGEYAEICGITYKELERYFPEGIKKISENYKFSYTKTLDAILRKYDGYRFTRRETYVCNPFSVLNAMRTGELDNYWVMSGSSKILVHYLKGSNFRLNDLTDKWVSSVDLSATYNRENPMSLFFQTGYLTIRDFDGDTFYRLDIPNQEVQSVLVDLLIPEYVEGEAKYNMNEFRRRLHRAIDTGDVDEMMRTLRSILARVPYPDIDTRVLEKHLQGYLISHL